MSEQEDGFIGSRLKNIPPSRLVHSTPAQLLLLARRQLIRLDLQHQTLAYAPLDDQKILHATYHTALAVYLLLTEKSLLAVNQSGELIATMSIEGLQGAKFVFIVALQDGYKGVPNNREDFLVYVKGDHLYACSASVFNERQMIKNKSICDLALSLRAPALLESPEFIQRQKHLPDCSLLILWDNNETYIYRTPTLAGEQLQRLHIYSKISKRENQSLDYAVSLPSKLMAVAFQSGVVKVFYLDHSKKYLCDLKGHQAACTTLLIPAGSAGLLYSCGLDSTVRVWNLRDYEQVYVLQLDLLVKESRFVAQGVLFLRSQELKQKSYLCQLNTSLLQPIVNDNVSGQLLKLRCDKDWCISIYSNNLVQFFSVNNHALSNQKLEYPLQYGAVVDVFGLGGGWYVVALQKGFSLIEFNKQEIKAENFELKKLVYNESILRRKEDSHDFIELIHEKLLGTYLFNAVSDWKNIPTAVTVTHLCFYRSARLPLWEGTNYRKNEQGTQRDTQERASKQKNQEGPNFKKNQQGSRESVYCVIGTAKGEVMFVDIAHRSHYATKVQFHTSAVQFIREVKLPNQKTSACFASAGADKQICIWTLSHKEPPLALVNVSHNRDISFLQVFENYLVVGEKDGEFTILQLQMAGDRELKAYKASLTGGHLRAVICGDYMRHRGQDLFLSGGEDSVIKMWRGVQKQLVFQLKLFGIVTATNFLHQELNLVVCHNEQISVIRQDKLKSLKRAEKLLESAGKADGVEEIAWRQFFYQETCVSSSPVRRSQLNRTNNSRHFQMSSRPTRVQDMQHKLVLAEKQCFQESRVIMSKPVSEPRLQLVDKRAKRFHLFTAAKTLQGDEEKGDNQLNLVLPSINLKSKGGRPAHQSFRAHAESTREQKTKPTRKF